MRRDMVGGHGCWIYSKRLVWEASLLCVSVCGSIAANECACASPKTRVYEQLSSIVYTYWLVLAALATVRPQPYTRTTDRISCTSLIFLGFFDKCRTTNQSSLSFDPDRTCLFFGPIQGAKGYIRALFIQSMLYSQCCYGSYKPLLL